MVSIIIIKSTHDWEIIFYGTTIIILPVKHNKARSSKSFRHVVSHAVHYIALMQSVSSQ